MTLRRNFPDWYDQAACKGADTGRYFPGGDTTPDDALQVCGTCQVVDHCLEEALSYNLVDDYGVWGATTDKERQEIRRHLKAGTDLLDAIELAVPVRKDRIQ